MKKKSTLKRWKVFKSTIEAISFGTITFMIFYFILITSKWG